MKTSLRAFWEALRTLSTDDAYDHYLQHFREVHAHKLQGQSPHAPLSRREFYIHQQQHKWSGIQRCC